MLRHTAATQLIEAGVDITHVQDLLGHAIIATTQIDTHVSDRSLRDEIARAIRCTARGEPITMSYCVIPLDHDSAHR